MKTAILARARPAVIAVPPPSPAAIAAGVPQGAQLQLSQRELDGARKRRQEIVDRQRALIAIGNENEAVVALGKERVALESVIRDLRGPVRAMRRERAAKVADVLGPLRREAADRGLLALAELRDVVRILDEIAVEVLRAGGEADRMALPAAFGEVEALLRRAGK